jgi:exopolysaccharide biosynthesis protein
VIHNAAYTFSEVRINHPSQFRRFLSGGSYGSGILLKTTDMAKSVNAVVASSGDYYAFRPAGIKVYEGLVRSANGKTVDTCFIDENGDLNFVRAGVMTKTEQVEDYVDEKNIRFSLSFGPVMIENGIKQPMDPKYAVGEITSRYSRAALCQVDELHYLLVTANMENGFESVPNLTMLQQTLLDMGVKHAYALDGGQTAALVMNDQLINRVDWGMQRKISDIMYFATAIPG